MAIDVRPMTSDVSLEDFLLASWRELLGTSTLGLDDNIFDHGADSLRVMALIARLHSSRGYKLSAQAVHAHPTSRRQARILDEATFPVSVMADAATLSELVDPSAELPLSEGQMETWVACQFGEMAALAFSKSFLLRLDGALDVVALRSALRMVWRRHDALHLSFAANAGDQQFHDDVPLPWADRDYSTPAEATEERLEAFCTKQAQTPFDTSSAPLLRFTLIRLDPARHALHVNAHHVVMDGWSLALLITELGACYSAIIAGHEPSLPAPDSFRRFLVDERARRDAGANEESLDYWRQVYASTPSVLRPPADRSAPMVPGLAAATERHAFTIELTAALRRSARRRDVSLYSLLLSGFGVLMARLSGQNDFAVGVPFAGLALASARPLIGTGVTTLPLRMQVGSEQSFAELAKCTHAALLDAVAHADTTLPGIQRALGLNPGGGEAALTSTAFSLMPRVPTGGFTGLVEELQECARLALNGELFFSVSDTGDSLKLDLHYATARYDATTMRRWIRHYEAVLLTIADINDSGLSGLTVGDIDPLDADSRRDVLNAWNDTALEYDRQKGLTALIETQMGRTPERIAAECDGKQITYAALERASRSLALALGRRGLGRGDRVGVCVPRSLAMLVGVLGVLRSGAAYVPLDPTFPAERLEYMAGHSRLHHVLITDVELLPVTVADGRELLDVDVLAAEPVGTAELPEVRGEDTAYVLYTSGSTGKPKGVGILHRNLVNFLLSMAREPGFTEDDILCAATTLSFDIAGLELYLPLITGGRMVITTDEEQHEPSRMWDLIDRSGCNVLQVTPSVLRLLQDTGEDRAVGQLRLFVGGEALPLVVANSMAGRCREFWNLYGPTETTIWSTVARIKPGMETVPLGRPIANTQIYVLDAQCRPLPPGVIGEIWIGGDGVAAGYLFQPELTVERFVADPFAGGVARMYRTGDLGAWRDGVLYFHGRTDHQIKVRGFRIEPGDIEAAADGHPAVRESVVMLRQFGDNDARLVLYAVIDGNVETTTRELREHLRHRLPRYMRPQHIEALPELPKTPNGKIDRNALPVPAAAVGAEPLALVSTRPDADTTEAMTDARELYIAGIWRELIGVQEILRSDNFLDLGGHSLLAVEFATRVRNETAVDLRLLNVFTGTLTSLAAELPLDQSISGSQNPLWSRIRERLARR